MPHACDVVVLGSVNTDYLIRGERLPEPGETVLSASFHEGPGGKGANQAVAAARAGAHVALVARVGADARGAGLRQQLADEGVDVAHVLALDRVASGAAVISVDGQGQKHINVAPGANARLDAKAVGEAFALIGSAKVLLAQLEIPVDAVRAAFVHAHAAGVTCVLDPAPAVRLPRELLACVDVMRCNHQEAGIVSGRPVRDAASAQDAAQALFDLGVGAVFMQAGPKGNILVTRECTTFMDHLQVETVDATGAGDACAGGLAASLARGLPLKDAARFGHTAAALATTQVGAQAGLPRRDAVERALGS